MTNHETMLRRWNKYLLEKGHIKQVIAAYQQHPDIQSFYVSFTDILLYDEEFANDLLDNPMDYILAGQTVIDNLRPPEDEFEDITIHFRIRDVRGALTEVDIRNVRQQHLGRLVSVRGYIRSSSQVRPRLINGLFKCMRCTHDTWQEQPWDQLLEPSACSSCEKKANNTVFVLNEKESTFTDSQRIELLEPPEEVNAQPQGLTAYLEDDLAGRVEAGQRVVLNGILKATGRTGRRTKTTTFDLHLYITSVETETTGFEDIVITEEDVVAIKALAEDGDLFKMMLASIAPSIYGMTSEKMAILFQLAGGVSRTNLDGTHSRGDIHILLVGDPGLAKSQLLMYTTGLAPRGIFASAQGSTKAGLTAAAIPEDDGSGRFRLEAGALVMADRGHIAIDELEKMNKEDRSSMHEAMAQQRITINKAGIHAMFWTRCAVLAAANPKHGRFEKFTTIIEQIDLPAPLVSRFDFIFPVTDTPDPAHDKALADHILETEADPDNATPPIERDFMRKYIAFARTIDPVLTAEARKRISDYYVTVRRTYGQGRIPLTARQLKALSRVAQAAARLRLSDEATIEDAERAIAMFDGYIRRVAGTEDGEIDIDIVTTGKPRSRIAKQTALYTKIVEYGEEGISRENLLLEAEKLKIDEGELWMLMNELKKEGAVYEPKTDLLYKALRA